MTENDLTAKIVAVKSFLNSEIVRIRTNKSPVSALSYREIGDRMDMIHEVERVGVRNLDERELRRITRLVTQLENFRVSAN